MRSPFFVVRVLVLPLSALLMATCACSQETLSERDFLFLAPQAPFKFIDLPEPYASSSFRQ